MDGKKLDLILNAIMDMKKEIKELTNKQDEQIANFNKMFADLKEENRNIKITVQTLEKENITLTNTITEITNDVNALKQQQLKNNLIIAGIPRKKCENLNEIFSSLSKLLKVNVTKSNFQIRRLTNSDSKTNHILVELNDYTVKNALLQNQKTANIRTSQLGFMEDNPISLFNQLTRQNLEVLAEAKELKNTWNFKFLWYQNNKILTRQSEKSDIIGLNSKNGVFQLISSYKTENTKKLEITNSSEIIDLDQSAYSAY